MTQQAQVWIPILISTMAILLSFWGAHRANVRRIQIEASERAEIKSKVDLIYQWFCTHVVGPHRSPNGD